MTFEELEVLSKATHNKEVRIYTELTARQSKKLARLVNDRFVVDNEFNVCGYDFDDKGNYISVLPQMEEEIRKIIKEETSNL